MTSNTELHLDLDLDLDLDLSVGREFSAFEELEQVLRERKTRYGERWRKGCGGRTVDNSNKAIKNSDRHFSPRLKYAVVNFRCIHEGNFTRTGRNKRNRSSCRTGCLAKFKVVAKRDKDKLVITKGYYEHTHDFPQPQVSDLKGRSKSIKPKRDVNQSIQKETKMQSESTACSSKNYLLTFLKKKMTNTDTEENLEPNSQNERLTEDLPSYEDQEVEPAGPNPAYPLGSTSYSMQQNGTKKINQETNTEERMIAPNDRCDGSDADRDFFNSLLPSVRTLTEDQKLEFRIQTLTFLRRIKNSGSVAPTEPLQQHRVIDQSMIHISSPQMLIPNTSHVQDATSSSPDWHFDLKTNRDCQVPSGPGSSTSCEENDRSNAT